MRLDRAVQEFDTELFQIVSLEFGQFFLFDKVWVFRTQEIETLIVQDVALGAFEPDEPTQERLHAVGDEVQLLPEAVQFSAFRLGQHLVDERLIVAKNPFHEVEARGQTAIGVHIVEAIGKNAATESPAR